MSQDNNNLFFSNEPPKEPQQPPQPPSPEPFNIGGGAQVYPSTPDFQQSPPQPVAPFGQPPQPPKKDNRKIWIIAIVAVVLLCCCCLIAVGVWLWNNGDAILEQMEGISYLVPAAVSLLA